MQRDGARTSIWQSAVGNYPSAGQLPGEVMDVVIVGGGITGLTTALLQQQAGKQCALVEAHTIGFGTTGGTTAHLNTFMDTSYAEIIRKFSEEDAKLVARAAKEAIALIRKNIADHAINCTFKELPGYLFATDELQSKDLDEILVGMHKVGVTAELTNTTVIPVPYQKIAVIEDQAQFNPLQYLFGLAEAFEAAGGVLLQGCRMLNLEEKEELEISTSKGLVRARDLVYATHIPPGVNLLHFRCAPYRSYALGVRLRNNDYPSGVVYDLEDPYHYYRTQEIEGQPYLIVGGEDHKTGHEENTNHCFRKLESHLRRFFDVEEVVWKWSSQYFEPADGLPYIGHLPGNPEHIYVATGFGGNGMIYGSFSAILLRDMLTNRDTPYEKLFDPNRLKPVAGFSNFVRESADVAAILINSLLPIGRLKEVADLAPGEARIVDIEGKKMGLYKDEQAQLYAVSATCTHIGCELQWNAAEKSWDCPCHGSRFSHTGEVLCAPARKDLPVYDLKAEEPVLKN